MNHPKVVLIVDDVPANLSLLFHHLRRANFRVLVAESGISALDQIQHVLPDIILLDVVMPGLSGFETCQQFKANPRTRSIPVIFLTSLTETIDKVRGFAVGGVDYVIKPLDAEEVLSRINLHLTLVDLQKELEQRNHHLDKLVNERTRELEQTNQSLRKEVQLRTESQQEKEKLFRLAQAQSTQLQALVDWLTRQQSAERNQTFNALYAPLHGTAQNVIAMLDGMLSNSKPILAEDLTHVRDALVNCTQYLIKLSADSASPSASEDIKLLERLTLREREMLQFLADGATSAEIADTLNIANVTVRTYRGRIMRKLGIHHTPGLVKFAIRHGLTSL